MRPFRNRGWRWLRYMEKILPVAGATGAHSFAASEAAPPSLIDDHDQELDHHDGSAASRKAPPVNNMMDVDLDAIGQQIISTSTSTPSTSKRPHSDLPAESGSGMTLSVPGTSSDRIKKVKTEKGKKPRTKSVRSSNHSATSTTSTTQRVDKITPAVAIVELHGSIKDMTQAIMVASKPPENMIGDKSQAALRSQEAVRLVQERDDGLSIMEKAGLIVFFGSHEKEADMYIALDEGDIRQAVVRQWIGQK